MPSNNNEVQNAGCAGQKWVLTGANLDNVLPAYSDASKRSFNLLRSQLEQSGVMSVYTSVLKQFADGYFDNKPDSPKPSFAEAVGKFTQNMEDDENIGQLAALKLKKKVLTKLLDKLEINS